MFVREKKTGNKKTGNIYVKHVLVESYHTTKGPRQKTVMPLSQIDLLRKKWSVLAKALENRLAAVPMQEQLSFVPENKIINHIRQSAQPELSHVDIYRKLNVRELLKRNHYIAGRRT